MVKTQTKSRKIIVKTLITHRLDGVFELVDLLIWRVVHFLLIVFTTLFLGIGRMKARAFAERPHVVRAVSGIAAVADGHDGRVRKLAIF